MNRRTLFTRSALFAAMLLAPMTVSAATLDVSPSATTVSAGETFTETVQVSSADQSINAVSTTVSFPTDLLQVISVTKVNSILTLWVVDPIYSNVDGTVSVSGIVPNPGYIGGRARVVAITFRAKRAGTAKLSFTGDEQVLANDGNGTNVFTDGQPAMVTILPSTAPAVATASANRGDLLAHITSSSHPDQTAWYRTTHAVFDWTNAPGVSAVKLGYDSDPSGTPIVSYADPISHKELDLADGITYFHVQEKNTDGWGPVASYRIQIDTVSPHAFDIGFPNGTTTETGVIATSFRTTDDRSGVDHYHLTLDNKEWDVSEADASATYDVNSSVGVHTLVVEAFDKAGNKSVAQAKFAVLSTTSFFALGWLAVNYLTVLLIILALVLLITFIAWYAHTHFRAYRYRLNRQLGLTQARVHKQFDKLKESITDELRRLEEARSRRTLTREEERLIVRFRALLDQSEQEIDREIENLAR
ncbi:MAG TPA: cohesin domain-containing protein [Candidatus Paceibacterota bacterium]|nr:cohesin domain-containing protein [Candidatus Paceibacterota bacterium]